MALVRGFVEGQQRVRVHTTEVDCYYQAVPGSETRIHLSTFGSDDRASEPKSSQSIQLDERQAKELIRILERTFPALRDL